VVARVSTELEELKRAENSPSLGKLHADSLLALLGIARAISDQAGEVMNQAQGKDDGSGEETIKVSLQRLRQRSDASVAALAQSGNRTANV
jgi:hypothetical protein